jgi:MoxR-like ATPase
MKSSAIKKSIKKAIIAKRPVYLWGAPGVGKSNVVEQVADELYAADSGGSVDAHGTYRDVAGAVAIRPYLIDVRSVLLDPVDLRGIPSVNGDGLAHWCQPDFLPRRGKGILFLDELSSAPPSTQAALYQLVLDRRLGDYVLPEGWTIIAAGNRETDRAVVTRMSSALASRFLHINFEIDLKDWVTWALGAGIRTEVIAFLRFRSELLHQFDPAKNEKAYPCPRTWQFVAQLLDTNLDADIEYELLAGTVGEGATVEFLGFLRVFRTLPNPDLVLTNPDKAAVPTDPATLHAICGALAKRANENNIERVVTYAYRLPVEFQVLLIHVDCLHHCPSIANTRAFIEWETKNQDVVL